MNKTVKYGIKTIYTTKNKDNISLTLKCINDMLT